MIGEFLSGSDDKTVKIWKGMFDLFKHCVEGACAETIDHPNTIWSVLSCTQEGTLLNNDIDIIENRLLAEIEGALWGKEFSYHKRLQLDKQTLIALENIDEAWKILN